MNTETSTLRIENIKLDNLPNQESNNKIYNLTADTRSPGHQLGEGTLISHHLESHYLELKCTDERSEFVKLENEDQGNASYEYQDLDKNSNYQDRLQAQEELLPLTPFKNHEHDHNRNENHLQKPSDQSFIDYCAALSPLQSRQQTPLSYAKSSLGKTNE